MVIEQEKIKRGKGRERVRAVSKRRETWLRIEVSHTPRPSSHSTDSLKFIWPVNMVPGMSGRLDYYIRRHRPSPLPSSILATRLYFQTLTIFHHDFIYIHVI